MSVNKPLLLTHQDTLDRESVIPLYHQLYEILHSHIESGIWQPGDLIPAESELKRQYGVSQITVRQALNILVDFGLIYRRRGQGTFVAQRRITSNLTHIVNFADDMKQRGMEPHTEMLEVAIRPLSKGTAELLHAEIDEEVAVIQRLRYANGEPLSIENSCLLDKYVPGILQFDFSQRSLSEVLASEYDIILISAEQTIRAQLASPEHASKLQVEEDSALLVIERVSYSQRNIPVEFLRIIYRADRYALHCELKGPS
jgi:GntR family transcriptional regulator